MRIRVTRKCIEDGMRQNPRRCPIAHAMAMAGLKEPSVGGTMAWWGARRETEERHHARAQLQSADLGDVVHRRV